MSAATTVPAAETAPQAAASLPIAGRRETARTAARLLGRRRLPLAGTTVLLLAGASASLVIPPALGRIVDLAAEGQGLRPVLLVCLLVLAAGLVAAAATWWGGRLLVACLQDALAELREEVMEAALGLDAGRVEGAGSSDVVSRVTGDVEAVTEAASGVLPRVIGAAFTIALTAVGLAALDPWLAGAALLAVPLQVLTTRGFLRRSRPLYVRIRHEEAARGQAIIETVAGSWTVRAHDHAEDRLQLIADRSIAAVRTGLEQASARNRFYAGLNAAELIGLAAVLAAGFLRVGPDGITVGAVTAAALFFHRLFGPIGSLLTSIDDLQRAQAGLERLVGVLAARPDRPAGREIEGARVEVSALAFSYPGAGPAGTPGHRRALDGVDLDLPAGSTTVLVGASGSGKSTLARIVAGSLDAEAGTVRIGGQDARAARHRGRPAVLLVSQEAHLFTGSIAENLRLARPEASPEELRGALAAVGARWALGDGDVGDLSGPPPADLDEARIQQIALARVLLADPAVVVLDEATAEAGADGTLDRAVAAVTAGRTAVVVAHRLRHAEQADLVVVMEDGRAVETGTPGALVRGDGPFAVLWEAWHHGRDER
ncbi:ABC transporter ATP-binding protein/permease [Brachybacterium sp. NBEC-018]|uniref:ABC transporter ATP-binding protein n=1 Tax=Brachybacterium sp. NBEC-018 TaxID=2996004 RepID=UPI0021756D24|nr:ABC transporter ATP-binding protein [Brachybacterium sp. NBEC-018]UVY84114.1 ABC transporter ATP-binding protein/permease [Brachybacterium sp. NBEC-018]